MKLPPSSLDFPSLNDTLTDLIVRTQVKNGNWDPGCIAIAMVQVRDGGGLDTLKVWPEKAPLEGQLLN